MIIRAKNMAQTLTCKDVISQLRSLYSLDIDSMALVLLQENPDLISILAKLIEVTFSYFNNDKLHLTIIKDPEYHGLDKLIVIVKTNLDSSIALSQLSGLDEELLQHNIPKDILVHVEFQ
jgi:hypothetical protein